MGAPQAAQEEARAPDIVLGGFLRVDGPLRGGANFAVLVMTRTYQVTQLTTIQGQVDNFSKQKREDAQIVTCTCVCVISVLKIDRP